MNERNGGKYERSLHIRRKCVHLTLKGTTEVRSRRVERWMENERGYDNDVGIERGRLVPSTRVPSHLMMAGAMLVPLANSSLTVRRIR